MVKIAPKSKIRKELFEISRLIAAELTESLTDRERERLKKWQGKSPQNGELHRRISGVESLRDDFADIRNADSWQALEQMRLHIDREERTRRPRLDWIVISAASGACLAICLLVLWPARKEVRQERNETQSDKYYPTLTMADGNMVRLDTMSKVISAGGAVIEVSDDRRLICDMNEEHTNDMASEIYTISVPRGNTFDIVLGDGTHVWLNAESSISFPLRFGGGERRVSIGGEVYFEVAKDPVVPFMVEARGQSIVVFGTEFNVNAYGDRVVTTLVGGSVAVSADGTDLTLAAGEQSVLEDGRIAKRTVNVAEYVSWREGYFVLEEQSFQSVMEAIGRWYDAGIVWRDPMLYDMEFEGRLPRFATLEETLDILEMTREVKFTIKDNRIEVGQ
jgi:ferric-dicitrate binding protein FerR (iron transport regulator)